MALPKIGSNDLKEPAKLAREHVWVLSLLAMVAQRMGQLQVFQSISTAARQWYYVVYVKLRSHLFEANGAFAFLFPEQRPNIYIGIGARIKQ